MLSATDLIYMIQLMKILGEDYVVWDKAASIKYKRLGKETIYCEFIFTKEEVEHIKKEVSQKKEILLKHLIL